MKVFGKSTDQHVLADECSVSTVLQGRRQLNQFAGSRIIARICTILVHFLYGESNKSVVNIGFGEGKLKLMKRLGPAPRSAGEVKSCAAALEE